MMIDDDQRREVAEELLRQAAYSSGSLGEWWQRLQETVTGEIDFANPQETYRAIADLIDRGESENVYDGSVQDSCDNGFLCSVCGYKVEDEEHYRVSGVWNFCPECGRRVRPKNE